MQPGQYSYPPQQPPVQQGYGYPQQPAPVADPFSDPRQGGTLAPKARDLVGRTVIVVPLSVDENSQYQGQVRPSARFDLVVVDGGPVEFGSDLVSHRPNTHRCDTPAYFRGVVSGNAGFVQQVRENVGRSALVVGVVEQGTKGNKPYLLTPTGTTLDGRDRPDGTARREQAKAVWFEIQAGTRVPTTPDPLVPQVTTPPASVSYAPAPQYQQPAPGVLQAPPGWDSGMWAQFTPAQQQQILGQQQHQPQAPVGPPPTGQSTGW